MAGLAQLLDTGAQRDAFDALLPLRAQGIHPPLFCIHPAGGLSWCYAGLLRHLSPDYPVYGLQAPALARPDTFPDTLEAMAADYAARIRTMQPAGPYHWLCLIPSPSVPNQARARSSRSTTFWHSCWR
ncbi:MAG TPA: thioesterase domain-containing protein [Pseudonocardiaceae bacterium]|nr:thioesterase domain-containing protein [Pseudonocardiaceae bacterium]